MKVAYRRRISRTLFFPRLRLGFYISILAFPLARGVATDIPALVQKAKPAVVEILTYGKDGKPLKIGTGFFMSPDGILLTNYHVISGPHSPPQCEWCDAEPISIIAKTPTGTVYFFKNIVAASETDDVVELQFSAANVPYLPLGSSSHAVEGQHVLVIGNPEGLEGTVSDGIISAFRTSDSGTGLLKTTKTMIQITAPISPGSSGSPVLDESGDVIGMATQVFREGQNLNLAISAETIRDAIRGDYAQQIRENPGLGQMYYERGIAHFRLGLYDNAISDITEALRLGPKIKTDVYCLNRGRAYANLKQYDKAISDITETIRQKPGWQNAYEHRAIVYFNCGQYGKAISDYSQAIRLDPNYYSDFYDERADAYDKLGQHSRAEQDRRKAKELRDIERKRWQSEHR
jgi:Flp pilus assembly protein TadD